MIFDSNSYGFWFQSYFDQIVFLISNNILEILENEKSMEISEKSLDNLCRNIFFLTIIFPARAAGWKNLMKFIIIQKLLVKSFPCRCRIQFKPAASLSFLFLRRKLFQIDIFSDIRSNKVKPRKDCFLSRNVHIISWRELLGMKQSWIQNVIFNTICLVTPLRIKKYLKRTAFRI